MKNIYNKGVYRDSQWVKHLSPFLKRICNRKWRRTANKQINVHLDEIETDSKNSEQKARLKIND
jgi:hypothetical protein